MVLLLVLLPFAAYIVGEKIGVSGILAAVAAGIATNFADLERSSYISERLQTEGTWSMVEAAFNGAIFLLLGLQLPSIIGVPLHQAGHDWWILVGYVAAISFALLLMRWIWLVLGVHGSLLRAHRQGKMSERPSPLLNLATTLAGIRGAVTLAGALSVPMLLNNGQPFPGRDMLVFLATGTILFTLVIGAVGLPIVLRHLPPHEESPTVREERLAREQACMAAMAKLTLSEEEMQRRDPEWVAMRQEVNGHLTQEYRNRIQLLDDGSGAAQSIELLREAPEVVRQRKLRYVMEIETRIECIHAERDFYYAERQAHRINDESLRSLVSELDMQEIAMRKRLSSRAAPPVCPWPARRQSLSQRRPEAAPHGRRPRGTRRREGAKQLRGSAYSGRLDHAQIQQLDHLVANPELLDLARHRHREGLDKADIARHLVVRDLPLQKSRTSSSPSSWPGLTMIQAHSSSP
jgi:CPA1 family monovalent cation:H+ antiporter